MLGLKDTGCLRQQLHMCEPHSFGAQDTRNQAASWEAGSQTLTVRSKAFALLKTLISTYKYFHPEGWSGLTWTAWPKWGLLADPWFPLMRDTWRFWWLGELRTPSNSNRNGADWAVATLNLSLIKIFDFQEGLRAHFMLGLCRVLRTTW